MMHLRCLFFGLLRKSKDTNCCYCCCCSGTATAAATTHPYNPQLTISYYLPVPCRYSAVSFCEQKMTSLSL
jgi:hypothetical protein